MEGTAGEQELRKVLTSCASRLHTHRDKIYTCLWHLHSFKSAACLLSLP